MNKPGLSTIVVALYAGTALVISAIVLTAFYTARPIPLWGNAAVVLAASLDRRADQLVRASPSPEDFEVSAGLSRRSVEAFPFNTGAWLRLAYIEVVRNGRFTQAAGDHLRTSYRLVPIDLDVGLWRLSFALEHVSQLPPDVRAAVKNEVRALWRVYAYQQKLRELARDTRNPAGRLSLELYLYELRSS